MKKIVLASFILMAMSACSSGGPSDIESSRETTQESGQAAASVKTSLSTEVSLPLSLAVAIKGFAFSPATVSVKKGGKVTWTNTDSVQHNIVANDGSFGSALLAKGASYSFTFNTAGAFTYFCGPHPNMKGTVVVK
jgi:plastocyanin